MGAGVGAAPGCGWPRPGPCAPPRRRARRRRAAAAAAAPPPRAGPPDDGFASFLLSAQACIVAAAEALDGSGRRFAVDRWQRDAPHAAEGYGAVAVLEGGALLEKAAVNVSVLHGVLTPERAAAMAGRGRAGVDARGGQPYAAAALSLVFHPASPLVPTLRADVRRFEVDGGGAFFGGGADLTPCYLHAGDVAAFHAHWKALCDAHDPAIYGEAKAACDAYFYLPARGEHRGTGGIFFDDVEAAAAPYDVEAFARAVAGGVLPSWAPIAAARRAEPFTAAQREWQLLRRGRYVEFNLLYDRGVRFGLGGGRMEAVMVSAPPLVRWAYSPHDPALGTPEAELLDVLRRPRAWV